MSKAGGLTFEEIVFACRNFGIDLGCGGCAAVFYTGYGAPHDERCTMPLQRLDGTIKEARCTCDDVGDGLCPRHICIGCRARTHDYSHGLCLPCEAKRKQQEKLVDLARHVLSKEPRTWPCPGCGRRNAGEPLRIVGYAYRDDAGRPTEVKHWTGCFACNDLRPLASEAREAMNLESGDG